MDAHCTLNMQKLYLRLIKLMKKVVKLRDGKSRIREMIEAQKQQALQCSLLAVRVENLVELQQYINIYNLQ